MITIFHKTIKDSGLKRVKEPKIGSWIYVTNPTEEDMGRLESEFRLEDGLVQDALDFYEVPRLETKDGIIYIFTRFPYEMPDEIVTMPALIAVGADFVITVCRVELPFMGAIKAQAKSGEFMFSTTQKTRLTVQLLTHVHEEYHRFLIKIRREVRRAQTSLEKITNRTIVDLVKHESTLNDFLSALQPMNAILQSLLAGRIMRLYEDDSELIEDVYLSNGQLGESCRSKLKSIMHVRNAYSTIMTNNLNQTMRFLTIVTVVLTIPTIVASLFGMNVPIPLGTNPYAFTGIVLFAILIPLILLIAVTKSRF